MKVDSHVRRTTSANDDENADEPKVTKVYARTSDIWHLKVQCDIYLTKWWVDLSSNLMVNVDIFLLCNKKKLVIL